LWRKWGKKKILQIYIRKRENKHNRKGAILLEVSTWLRYVCISNSVPHNKQLNVQFQKYIWMKITDTLLSTCLVTNTEQHNTHIPATLSEPDVKQQQQWTWKSNHT
jgi:hypothetical protein